MAVQESIVEESIDRVQNAVRSFGDDFERFQKRFEKRRKQLEKDTQKRVKRLRAEFEKSPFVKRAEDLRSDATRQIGSGVDRVLARLQIASRADVRKLDRKLGQISRKLSQIEKTQHQRGASV